MWGSDIVYGRAYIDRLDELLAERGMDAALVVCGSNVGGESRRLTLCGEAFRTASWRVRGDDA